MQVTNRPAAIRPSEPRLDTRWQYDPASIQVDRLKGQDITGERHNRLSIEDNIGNRTVMSNRVLRTFVSDDWRSLGYTEATQRGFEGEGQNLRLVDLRTGRQTTVKSNQSIGTLREARTPGGRSGIWAPTRSSAVGSPGAIFANAHNGKSIELDLAKVKSIKGDVVTVQKYKMDSDSAVPSKVVQYSLAKLLEGKAVRIAAAK